MLDRLLVSTALLLSMVFVAYSDVWWGPWYGLHVALIVAISSRIIIKRDSILGLNFLYWLAMALLISNWRPALDGYQIPDQLTIKNLTKESLFSALILFLFFEIFDGYLPLMKKVFQVLWWLEAITICFPLNHGIWHLNGLMGSTSIGTTFLALTFPLVFPKRWLLAAAFIMGLAVWWHSATATMAVAVALTVLLLSRGWRQTAMLPILSVLIAGPFFKGAIYGHQDRYTGWHMYLNDWWVRANHFLGWGHGAFKYYGPMAQERSGFGVVPGGMEVWLWPHSDWLQLLLDGGYIGLSLAFALFVSVVWRYWRRQDWPHLACALTFGFAMVAQYPLNIAVTTMFAGYLIYNSFERAT